MVLASFRWRAALAVFTVAWMGGMAVSVSLAGAETGPAWNVMASTSPTHIVAGTPNDEVQEVIVTATGGTFTLSIGTLEGILTSKPETTRPIPYNASAAFVKNALEELINGKNDVSVVEGSGGSGHYVVTFENGGGDAPQALMEVDGQGLTGSGANAAVSELAKGHFPPTLVIMATNVGGSSAQGSPITVSDVLPPGVTATRVAGREAYSGGEMTCEAQPVVSCTYSGGVDPGDVLRVEVTLAVASAGLLPLESNRETVTGGGAQSVTTLDQIEFSEVPSGFGPAPNSVLASLSNTQAGAHPDITTAFTLSTSETDTLPAEPKDISFDLPPGFVGNTVGIPRCSMQNVKRQTEGSICPADSLVGMATIAINAFGRGSESFITPVYNIAPAPGEPAAFAFDALYFPVRLDTSVLSNGDYGVRVTAPNLTQGAQTLSTSITIWGVPADHSGPGSYGERTFFSASTFGGPNPGQTRVPLLTSPQQCSEPLKATMLTDSWSKPGVFKTEEASVGRLSGCDKLSFESSFSMLPDTLEAGAPAGYSFKLDVPQNKEPDGLATPNVKGVKLALPVGTVVSPSAAWGLKACSDAEFALHSGEPSDCPREAQVGTVQIKTPALEEALQGVVYLAEPLCNPCSPRDAEDGRMVRLFLQVVGEGESGIVVKLEGSGSINSQTGQITTSFENNPQLPFDELTLNLGGGPRATLANPRTCGPATSNLDLTPWSTPFTPDSTPSYSFEINQGCITPQFHPSFVAGTTNVQAGEYSPFTLSFGRSDADQFLNGIQLRMPAGLLGSLANVPLCGEPQAALGTCSQASLIGHTQVLTGPGADPFLVTGGQVFLTESYKGAPFGLSIVVPAKAGPYTLSGTTGTGTVVVRAAINIDPHSAALTVTSDPLPTQLDGIPLQLKVVNVTIDRPGFTLNPTSCAKKTIEGTLTSKESAGASVSSPFQATNCAGLGFKPTFKVSTNGHTSRANGASLDAKVIYPANAVGSYANIAKVKVDLPKQLPSRLTTLQKACPAATFDVDPTGCPRASVVGIAKANTPILPVQLTGPVYFVSHGGEEFPNLIVVLQGYGVRVDLIGDTFISKSGITSSTFKNVPDVPVSSFELYLPEGRDSALAANGNLCKSTLRMPTAFTGQNGMVIHQSTPIAVTGCGKAKRARTSRRRGYKANAHRVVRGYSNRRSN